jgi:hypothetical protein
VLETITGGCAYAKGFFVVAEGLVFFKLGSLLLVADYPIRQLVLCEMGGGGVALWELNPEVFGSLWQDRLCDWGGGGITSAKSLCDWGRRAVPILNSTLAFALQLRKSTENLGQGSRVVGEYSLRQPGRLFMDSLGWATDRQSTSVTRGWLQSALGQHKCLPICRTKGFPTSANFESKLSGVEGEEWNPQIFVNLPVTNVPRCVCCNAKTLGL